MGFRSALLLASLSSFAAAAALGGSDSAGWTEVGAGLPDSGQWRNGFDLADFDGDGRLDLVHGPPRRGPGGPRIFRGSRTGAFESWDKVRFPDLPYDYGDAAAADFDGDGHLDLALGVHSLGVFVLRGDGAGSFRRATCCSRSDGAVAGFPTRALAVGDLDGDGRPDIVAMGEGGGFRPGGPRAYGVRIFRNRLPASWEELELQPERGRLFADALTLGDFDGSKNLDIATASSTQGQAGVVFWNDGAESFASARLDSIQATTFVTAVASADFDRNGRDDLAIARLEVGAEESSAGLELWSYSGEKWSGVALPWPRAAGRGTALGTGDFDGDGDPDLVALGESGALLAFVNSAGKLEPVPGLSEQEGGRGCRGYHVQLADLDLDGRDDVVAGFADEGCAGGGGLRAWAWSETGSSSPDP